MCCKSRSWTSPQHPKVDILHFLVKTMQMLVNGALKNILVSPLFHSYSSLVKHFTSGISKVSAVKPWHRGLCRSRHFYLCNLFHVHPFYFILRFHSASEEIELFNLKGRLMTVEKIQHVIFFFLNMVSSS